MKDKKQNKTVLYEQIFPPGQTVTKNDVELQPNPAYGTSHEVTMDTNPAYKSYKWLTVQCYYSLKAQTVIYTYVTTSYLAMWLHVS